VDNAIGIIQYVAMVIGGIGVSGFFAALWFITTRNKKGIYGKENK
jgi:hypothetical protein